MRETKVKNVLEQCVKRRWYYHTINSKGASVRKGEEELVRDAPGALTGHVHHQQAEARHVSHVHIGVRAVATKTLPYVHYLQLKFNSFTTSSLPVVTCARIRFSFEANT